MSVHPAAVQNHHGPLPGGLRSPEVQRRSPGTGSLGAGPGVRKFRGGAQSPEVRGRGQEHGDPEAGPSGDPRAVGLPVFRRRPTKLFLLPD